MEQQLQGFRHKYAARKAFSEILLYIFRAAVHKGTKNISTGKTKNVKVNTSLQINSILLKLLYFHETDISSIFRSFLFSNHTCQQPGLGKKERVQNNQQARCILLLRTRK